jgi:hypothetical protein
MDTGVTTPLLLWIFAQPSTALSLERRTRCLHALESFLVRRMVCRLTAKNYNDLFLELLSRLEVAGPADADEVMVDYLASQEADSRLWPDDHAFEMALLDLPLYRLLTRSRLRMVLEALEDSLRTSKSEEASVQRGKLTIEHILPRRWRQHWPIGNGGFQAEIDRERLLHSLGNLTLVNGRLNPSMSNGAWPVKQKALAAHSVLHLNKRLGDAYADRKWDEATIHERGTALAAIATHSWPSSPNI